MHVSIDSRLSCFISLPQTILMCVDKKARSVQIAGYFHIHEYLYMNKITLFYALYILTKLNDEIYKNMNHHILMFHNFTSLIPKCHGRYSNCRSFNKISEIPIAPVLTNDGISEPP